MDFESETFVTEVTGTLTASLGRRSGTPNDDNPGDYLIAHTLRGEGFDAPEDGMGRGTPIVPVILRGHSDYGDGLPCLRAEGGDAGGGSEALIAFDTTQITSATNRSNPQPGIPCHPLAAQAHAPAIAFSCKDHGADAADELAPTLRAMGHGESHPNAGGQVAVAFAIQERAVSENPDSGPDGIGVAEEVAYTLEARTTPQAVGRGWAVRRLTPTECARLQGFPDHHSRIPWRGKPAELCPDGPQYKCYGNSMAVTVMRWLAERIQFFSAEREA